MLSFVSTAYAACSPGSTGGFNLSDCLLLNKSGDTVSELYDTPATLINLIVRNVFVAAGIIFFLMVFYSGFKFISGGTKGKDEAKTIMTTATIGFVVMFVSFWIVQIVEAIAGMEII